MPNSRASKVASLPRELELPLEQDYAALRELGMEHIRAVAGEIWTDHNLHDPGITSLEVLCYALTDLGYRTNFPIEDLMTEESGERPAPAHIAHFPAQDILPTAPLTLADYRRLLMNVDSVRNAWLVPLGSEHARRPELYLDLHEGELTYSAQGTAGANERVALRGLYSVLVELEVDDELGSLSDPAIVHRASAPAALRGGVFSVDCTDAGIEPLLAHELVRVTAVTPPQRVSAGREPARFEAKATIELSNGATHDLEEVSVLVIDDRPDFDPDANPLDVTPARVRQLLARDQGPLASLWKKRRRVVEALEKVRCALGENRNLCEDFEEVVPVPADRIAVCADIDVEPGADLEVVYAEIMHAIERYLNPPVPRYSLHQLLELGVPVDEIFDGPYVDLDLQCKGKPVYTQPGFARAEDLAQSELRRRVLSSDLIRVAMATPGVVAVRNVLLRRYDERGVPEPEAQEWCLDVKDLHQPSLDRRRSRLNLFKDSVPLSTREAEREQTLVQLRHRSQESLLLAPDEGLPEPIGRFRRPGRHLTVQNDFPLTYGIGEPGLPHGASAARRGEAHQLKAFLAIFDQFLADYLSQLANLTQLFSIQPGEHPTFPREPFLEAPPVRREASESFEAQFVKDPEALTRDLLAELPEDAARRRGRVLDHLLARFAERFADHVLLQVSPEDIDRVRSQEELNEAKREFLESYPETSRGRATGFNVEATDAPWDSDRVSGLERRVAGLLGIVDLQRRSLHCEEIVDRLFQEPSEGGQFRVEIGNLEHGVPFRSAERFATEEAAREAARAVYPAIARAEGYDRQALEANRVVVEHGGVRLTHATDPLPGRKEAVDLIHDIANRHRALLFSDDLCNLEGFHLIEHLLLRPRQKGDPTFDPCTEDPECYERDPYSFRASVVLPAWPRRFRDPGFRAFVEKTLREECPAHVFLKICWVSNEQMMEVDRLWRAWVTRLRRLGVRAATRRREQEGLLRALENLRSIHPPAVLHDCDDDGSTNVVRLDQTSLGTL